MTTTWRCGSVNLTKYVQLYTDSKLLFNHERLVSNGRVCAQVCVLRTQWFDLSVSIEHKLTSTGGMGERTFERFVLVQAFVFLCCTLLKQMVGENKT